LRAEAVAALRGCDHIIHAGDIGSPTILQSLSGIAPVTAIRGNNDTGEWAESIPDTQRLQFGEVTVYVIHDLKELDIEPNTAGVSAVISGHSHKPVVEERDGVLYINPGSAGRRRFKLPITVAELVIEGQSVTPRIMHLDLV
jgi:putative phosphoesterase